MIKLSLLSIFNLLFILNLSAQDTKVLKGLILDIETQSPLPYTNIVVLDKNTGTISNEQGYFSLDITNLEPSDSLRFQYIGYKIQKMTIADLDSSSIIYLKEEIINLSEAFVFSDPPKAKDIVEKVIEHKASNYQKRTVKNQTFIRWRNISDIDKIGIKLKRNSIPELNKRLLKVLETKIPKHNTSYTDFLGHLYFSKNESDTLKISPTRTVSLKEKDVSELEQLESIFEKMFANTDDKEYWKVKSGIISQKIDINDGEASQKEDSLKNIETDENSRKIASYTSYIDHQLYYTSLESKSAWEFLYSTGKYNYELAGGTRMNGEDVYIIDFTPKKSGLYVGRVYISINTYALIRADYQYDVGKQGTNFNLLGIGYTMSSFSGSIFFERIDETYVLKYFSQKTGTRFSFDRNISLIKKRKRFLIDKELFEIKVKFNISVSNQESIEVLMLDEKAISQQQFNAFEQKKYLKIIYVDQFNEDLWKGYPIIEPTQQMREYKKQDLD